MGEELKFADLVEIEKIIDDWAKKEQLGTICTGKLKDSIKECMIPEDVEDYNPRLSKLIAGIIYCKVCGMPVEKKVKRCYNCGEVVRCTSRQ